MNYRFISRFAWSLLVGGISPFAITELAEAVHISTGLDVAGTRTSLGSDEGYLSFHFVASPFGEERTGWTDIRHPANDGNNFTDLTNTDLGYDRSDFIVQVHNKIVTIDKIVEMDGMMMTVKDTATPDIPRDYDFANQIWNQIGISVLSTGQEAVDHSTGNAAGNPVVTAPITGSMPDDIGTIQGVNRQADPVVNNWYGTVGDSVTLRGITSPPTAFPTNNGIMIFDSAVNDTFAHELGHFLLDEHQFNNAADKGHSPSANDLMAAGSIRQIPSNNQKGSGNTAPRDPGLTPIGNLGTTSHFDEPVKLNGMGADIEQMEAVHRSPFIQRNDNG